jgi:arginase
MESAMSSRNTAIQLLGIAAGQGARISGAEEGPYDLRERGLIDRLTKAGLQVEDLGNIRGVYETRPASGSVADVNNLEHVLQVNRHIHACVLGMRRKSPNSFLLVIGGDHSLAIGTLGGLADSCNRLGILWIDAHADFNTPRSSPSGNAHGMSLAIACGRGNVWLRSVADRDPMVVESDVYLMGCRDIDPPELEALRGSRVNWLSMDQFRRRGLIESVSAACEQLSQHCDHIHLSFDIDVIDPAFVRGTGTPVPGGLTPDEAIAIVKDLGCGGKLRSAEFVEYNPLLDTSGNTGALVLKLIEALLVGDGSMAS